MVDEVEHDMVDQPDEHAKLLRCLTTVTIAAMKTRKTRNQIALHVADTVAATISVPRHNHRIDRLSKSALYSVTYLCDGKRSL